MLSVLLLVICIAVMPVCARAQDEIRLIVRGDDLGMTQGSLVAFEQAINNGVLTSASLQVPAPWFEGAVELIHENPGWCVGIHLTLVGEWIGNRWRPVLPYNEVPSLVDEDGYFHRYPDELNAHNPDPKEIEAELRAQIALARKKGVEISYLDNHYGAVTKCPGGNEILEKLSREFDLPISGRVEGENVCRGIYSVPKEEKLESTVEMLSELTPGLWMWYCHPGIDSPEQNALIHTSPNDMFIDGVGPHRTAVLEALTSLEVRTMILNKGIILTDYKEVWDAMK